MFYYRLDQTQKLPGIKKIMFEMKFESKMKFNLTS